MNIKEDFSIVMAKGDYGQGILFKIKSDIIESEDIIRIKINQDEQTIITKEFTDLEPSEEDKYEVNFVLTEEDSNLLDVGYYEWGFEHERNGVLLNDLLINNEFTNRFEVKRGI